MFKKSYGFTLIEVILVVTIIGILSTMVFMGFNGTLAKSRDSERLSKVTVIAEGLEKYYQKNGEYPPCNTAFTNSPNSVLPGLDRDAVISPSGNSITCLDITNTSPDKFAYVVTNGQWKLKYKSEFDGTIKELENRKDVNSATQFALTLTAGTGGTVSQSGTSPYYHDSNPPTITATANNNYSFDYWTGSSGCSGSASHTITMDRIKSCTASFSVDDIDAPLPPTVSVTSTAGGYQTAGATVACTDGTPEYSFRHRTGYNTATYSVWSSYTAWSSVQTSSLQTNQGYKTGWMAQARCKNAVATSPSATSGEVTLIRVIDTPAMPTYLSPAHFHDDDYKIVTWAGYCPANTTVTVPAEVSDGIDPNANTGVYTAIKDGTHYHHLWGYNQHWNNSESNPINVIFYGQYRCKTEFTTSSNSPTSDPGFTVIVYENEYHNT